MWSSLSKKTIQTIMKKTLMPDYRVLGLIEACIAFATQQTNKIRNSL
jgi:hypothetical protein